MSLGLPQPQKEVPMRLSKILPAALVLFVALATPAMAQVATKYLPVTCQEPGTRLETKLAYPHKDGQPNFTGTLVKVGYDCPAAGAEVFSVKALNVSLTDEGDMRATARAIPVLVATGMKPELAAELLKTLGNPDVAQAIATLAKVGIQPDDLSAAMTRFRDNFTKTGD